MNGFDTVIDGCELIVNLLPYVKPPMSKDFTNLHVAFNVMQHAYLDDEEMFDEHDKELAEGLKELDTFDGRITMNALHELVEHMKKLSKHKVFECGRTFFFEDFSMTEDSTGVYVEVCWGS